MAQTRQDENVRCLASTGFDNASKLDSGGECLPEALDDNFSEESSVCLDFLQPACASRSCMQSKQSQGADSDLPHPFSATQPIDLATQLPPTWFNSIRNEENRLDSSPVPLQFRLSRPLADKVEAEVQAIMRQQSVTANDAILRVMHSCMKVDVVYYDGQPVTIFCPDSAVHETLVPAPQIVSAEFVHSQQSLTVCVTRKLPLSSAHANRFFRLGFLWTGHGVEHVLFTRAISVLAKQAPGAERKQKYFASHKAEPSRTCWILQRAASSRGMDLSKSFDSACAPAPMGVGGHKRARVVDASPQSNASFARTAAGECKVKRARRLPGQQLCAMRRTARVDAWDFDGAELCSPPSPGVPECPQALAVVGFESDDTASDVRSVSPCQDDDDVSIVHEMWRLKAGAEAEAAAAGKRSCGDPLARFFKRGCSVPPPSAVPCHIPCVSRCASPLPTPHAFNAGDSSESDCAVPPRVTPHQAPVIATQAPNASQAVSTPDDDAHPFSPRSESVFQVPNPPSSMGQFVGLAAGLADMARQDSLERGHSLIGHEDHGSHGSLPFADLLALGPSQDASLPELARSYSARSGMSVGSGFNLGGQ